MLNSYGWSQALQQQFQTHAGQGLNPARVIVQQRGLYVLATSMGEVTAQLSGRFAHDARAGDYPVAGDWVAVAVRPDEAAATIQHLLPRRGAFMRKAVGGSGSAQVVAANVDVAFLVASLKADLNARRIERYLATAWESGGAPVIVLTKADLCHDRPARQAEIEAVALGVPVHVVSAVTGEGLADLGESFAPGQTAALLGSSGVGKSSLVNALAGRPLMATQAIREDDARGRHTTTHRQLVLLPSGRLVLDTPGMRELGLWDADAGVAAAFADIEELAGALPLPRLRPSERAGLRRGGRAGRRHPQPGSLAQLWQAAARARASQPQGRSEGADGSAQGLDTAHQAISRQQEARGGG